MKHWHFLSAITVIVSESILYGFTNAVPVIKCDPMPNISARNTIPTLPVNQVPNEYVIHLQNVEDTASVHKAAQEYIESQKPCHGAKPDNQISVLYKSQSGGGALLFGIIDPRVHSWAVKYLGSNGTVEPNAVLELAAISTVHDSPWPLPRLNKEGTLKTPDKRKFNEFTRNWPSQIDDTKLGDGSRIYILDSGIQRSHNEFLSENGETRVEDGQCFGEATTGPATEDTVGHGTAVAGVAAGKSLGVARLATIVPYKVCSTAAGPSIKDLQHAIHAAVDDFAKKDSEVGVINISIDIGKSKTISDAIKHAGENKMHVTVAAGNTGDNICDRWITRGDWIGVGGTTIDDELWVHSNYGECVDLYAPGHRITVPMHSDKTKYSQLSGTSLAAAHAAGVIAIIGASKDGGKLADSPSDMKEHILSSAARDRIEDMPMPKRSHNLILRSPVQETATTSEFSSGAA